MSKAKTPLPWQAVDYDEGITAAIKALNAGNANEGQQQRALKWIIEVVCATYEQPFQPDGRGGSRATEFMCGRMFAGQQIIKQTKLTTSAARNNS